MIPDTSTVFPYSFSPGLRTTAKFSRDLQLPQKYSNPKEFLTPSPRHRGGLGWGKKFTIHLGMTYAWDPETGFFYEITSFILED